METMPRILCPVGFSKSGDGSGAAALFSFVEYASVAHAREEDSEDAVADGKSRRDRMEVIRELCLILNKYSTQRGKYKHIP